jgi:hypothetical protein
MARSRGSRCRLLTAEAKDATSSGSRTSHDGARNGTTHSRSTLITRLKGHYRKGGADLWSRLGTPGDLRAHSLQIYRSHTPSSDEKRPGNAWHLPRRYRVRPPPVVGPLLAGLGYVRLPAVFSKQSLRIVGSEAPYNTTPGEGCQQRPHHRGVQEISTHKVRAEPTVRRRKLIYAV